ncbi:MAG TPA: TfoX family protein [Thiotrichaceae bacterium]|jgi:DNA transformation protein|nr:TfoX family protein [Thiotrichaceae bacterium]HIM08242.1 TfoX family protein [Gammaproteobacteria bacterium]
MSEFVNYLHEVFQYFGSIRTRKMFGGHGIYHDDIMIGLVTDDTLYFKVDESTKQEFIDKDLSAFEYSKDNKKIQMSYYLAPEEIYDEPDEAVYWAKLAYQAALNSKSK